MASHACSADHPATTIWNVAVASTADRDWSDHRPTCSGSTPSAR